MWVYSGCQYVIKRYLFFSQYIRFGPYVDRLSKIHHKLNAESTGFYSFSICPDADRCMEKFLRLHYKCAMFDRLSLALNYHTFNHDIKRLSCRFISTGGTFNKYSQRALATRKWNDNLPTPSKWVYSTSLLGRATRERFCTILLCANFLHAERKWQFELCSNMKTFFFISTLQMFRYTKGAGHIFFIFLQEVRNVIWTNNRSTLLVSLHVLSRKQTWLDPYCLRGNQLIIFPAFFSHALSHELWPFRERAPLQLALSRD